MCWILHSLQVSVRASLAFQDNFTENATTATGTAEVGGWSTREFLTILDGLEGLNVIGADVGE